MRRSERVGTLRRWAWVVWMALILVWSLVPSEWILGPAPRESWSALSLAGHVVEFLVLALLIWWWRTQRSGRRAIADAVWMTALAGLAVELLQAPIPYRDFAVLDLAADAAGIVLAVIVISVGSRAGRSNRACAR